MYSIGHHVDVLVPLHDLRKIHIEEFTRVTLDFERREDDDVTFSRCEADISASNQIVVGVAVGVTCVEGVVQHFSDRLSVGEIGVILEVDRLACGERIVAGLFAPLLFEIVPVAFGSIHRSQRHLGLGWVGWLGKVWEGREAEGVNRWAPLTVL